MYSKKQKDIALRIYHQTESVTETIRILGYPTRRNLYTWIAEENTPPKTRKEYPVIDNPPDHPRNPPLEVKLDAIHRCYELGENIKYVSEDCIFRKNRALAPHERSAVPLGTDHCPVG